MQRIIFFVIVLFFLIGLMAMSKFHSHYRNGAFAYEREHTSESEEFEDSSKLLCYLKILKGNTSPQEYEKVVHFIDRIAKAKHSNVLPFYNALALECGLNPFKVREDSIAAGIIQFTTTGLKDLEGKNKGDPPNLEKVIHACKNKDIDYILFLTEQYLQKNLPKNPRPIDVYLAIFSPASIGKSDKKVVYAGYKNPAYYLNAGLDIGIGTFHAGKKDGKITVGEIRKFLYRMNTKVHRNCL